MQMWGPPPPQWLSTEPTALAGPELREDTPYPQGYLQGRQVPLQARAHSGEGLGGAGQRCQQCWNAARRLQELEQYLAILEADNSVKDQEIARLNSVVASLDFDLQRAQCELAPLQRERASHLHLPGAPPPVFHASRPTVAGDGAPPKVEQRSREEKSRQKIEASDALQKWTQARVSVRGRTAGVICDISITVSGPSDRRSQSCSGPTTSGQRYRRVQNASALSQADVAIRTVQSLLNRCTPKGNSHLHSQAAALQIPTCDPSVVDSLAFLVLRQAQASTFYVATLAGFLAGLDYQWESITRSLERQCFQELERGSCSLSGQAEAVAAAARRKLLGTAKLAAELFVAGVCPQRRIQSFAQGVIARPPPDIPDHALEAVLMIFWTVNRGLKKSGADLAGHNFGMAADIRNRLDVLRLHFMAPHVTGKRNLRMKCLIEDVLEMDGCSGRRHGIFDVGAYVCASGIQ
mmetsp:Transcript_72621/g.200380  ORF Transcript_72621/g.200380 Transcript_72621/m.200380 type:complete len:464 (+) Transcript_72621:102-1493(+)